MSYDLSHILKRDNEWLKEADSASLQQSLRHLEKAYKNYFRKRSGYPRFKKKRSHQSYRTMNVNGNIAIDGDHIKLPKAGYVKIVNTRDFDGKIISATVTKTASGRYYISLQVEEEYEVLPNNGGQIGLDAGLKALYTDSDSNMIINPRTLAKHEKRIKRLQRELSRKQKGSRNREKARLRLAKAVSDASWSSFYRKLGYKMADHGGVLVRVPRTYILPARDAAAVGRYILK